MRLLIVEDEPTLCEQLEEALGEAGYAVDIAVDGEDGAYRGATEPYDAIVLDLGLPRLDGLSVLRGWRAEGVNVPVCILTARGEWHEKVDGMDAGADDYLIKPFSIDELMARLRAMHRRVEVFSGSRSAEDRSENLLVADLSLNTRTRDVRRGERSIHLSVKEYDLLNFLMRGAGRVLERNEIMRGVWGENFYGDDNLLDVYIRYLRQKVESTDRPALIHTVRGVGFILREERQEQTS